MTSLAIAASHLQTSIKKKKKEGERSDHVASSLKTCDGSSLHTK